VRLLLLSVGKPRAGAAAALHDLYAGRIPSFGVGYEARWVPEVRAAGRYSDDHVREREGEALRAACPAAGTVVALDRSGALLDSEALAGMLERWASPAATFLVGGPLGLHRTALEGSDRVWSLSPLTFPHELARALVAEQLYRAITILRGVPYHK
jgi:23S rRNA (pseudouridine1915-N3)-methyltransferase